MKARRWLLAALAGAVLTAGCGERETDGASGPNLLLICADTLRADFFLHPDIEDAFSPWLARGLNYTRAHTTSPWTLPTIASVFTGLYPARHGAGALPGPVANLAQDTPTALDPEAVTLAEALAGLGVATGLFSAHPWLKEGFGLDQGFSAREYDADDQALVDQALDWLDDQRGQSFTYLHLMGAHDLHRTSRTRLEEILAGVDAPTREFLAANATSRACTRPDSARCLRNQVYLLSLLRMRATLADLLQRLEAGGHLANTYVLLFSDHGEAFGEHLREQQRLGPDPRSDKGGGHGQYLYQELLRVPLLAWRPDGAAGQRDALVSLVDLFPTALDWMGFEGAGTDLPGRALPVGNSQAAAGPSDDADRHRRAIFASHIAYGPQSVAVLAGHEKAIYWLDEDVLQIYDLDADPGEKNPLANDPLELEFSTLAGDYLDLERLFDGGAPQLDAQHLQDLQAIGYLQGEDDE